MGGSYTATRGLTVGVSNGDNASLTIVSHTGNGRVQVAPNQAAVIGQDPGSTGSLFIDNYGQLTTGNLLSVGQSGPGPDDPRRAGGGLLVA